MFEEVPLRPEVLYWGRVGESRVKRVKETGRGPRVIGLCETQGKVWGVDRDLEGARCSRGGGSRLVRVRRKSRDG